MKQKKKILNSILILGCILVILLIFLMVYKNNSNELNSEEKLNYINDATSFDSEKVSFPKGAEYVKLAYKGELSAQSMGKSMHYFTTEVIPEYYSKLNDSTDSEISAYYNSNQKNIAIDTGINKEEDFQNLILSIQNFHSKDLILEAFRMGKDNIKSSDEYTDAVIYITYKENKEIAFNVRIFNSIKKNTSSIMYTALK